MDCEKGRGEFQIAGLSIERAKKKFELVETVKRLKREMEELND